MFSGRKAVGSAQLRQGGALLQHGSILLSDNQAVVLDLMNGERSAHESIPLMEPWAQASDIAEAITSAAALRWPGTWQRISDEKPILSRASSNYTHYRSTAWTWAR